MSVAANIGNAFGSGVGTALLYLIYSYVRYGGADEIDSSWLIAFFILGFIPGLVSISPPTV